MSGQRLVILDPAGRTASEICAVAARAGVTPVVVGDARMIDVPRAAAVLVPAAAAESIASLPSSVPRWLYGDIEASARLASAAIACTAAGVVLLPSRPEVIQLLVTTSPPHVPEVDLARARSLIAASVLDGNGEPTKDGLGAIAKSFAADDCVLWWREGEAMAPWGTRAVPDTDQATLGAAARVAAATGLTVLAATARKPMAVVAAPLSTGPQEVGGLIAVLADRARRFTPGELADLRAIATRLPRELTFRAGHRRLVAEHERLAAGAQTDPLTGMLSRTAFDQEVASAIASAARRNETLTVALFDVVGLRRVNLERGHKAGDAVLTALAARVRAHVRGNDRVGRFGGDELAILFVGTDTARAQQAARKLAAHVAATPIPTAEGDVTVQVRGAVTAVVEGERSGEAGFARLRHAVRSAKPGAVVVAGNARPDTDAAYDDAAAGVTTGTTLGGTYRILHELSRGAMGVVYRGEDLGLSRPVAIKVLRSDLASDAQLVTKFRAEAAMLASLHHTNLVQVYSLGEHQGDVYFVMELVEGQALAEVLETQHTAGQWLPFEALAQIALEIGDALDAMHAIGLIHRDVKPANVLLDRERDRAVLVDVGVAKRRGDEVDGAGTPGYAAPESFLEGSSESPETDVYGLAATMFCALTGRPPFGSGQLMQVITRQLHEPLMQPSKMRPGLTVAVDEVMAKALDPEQKRRFQSASSFAMALTRALERAPKVAPEDDSTHERAVINMPPQAVLKQTEVLTHGMRQISGNTPHPDMVRAAHFRVAGRVVAHLAGDAAVRAICEADAQLASALAPGASPLGWLPLELLCRLVERAAEHVRGRGTETAEQLIRAIGRSTVSATFARFFGADPATLGVVSMLAVLPSMWGRYHGWCKARVMKRGAGAADVIVVGSAPPLAVHLVAAELAKACELAGATNVDVAAQSDGREHRFAVTWNAIPDV